MHSIVPLGQFFFAEFCSSHVGRLKGREVVSCEL